MIWTIPNLLSLLRLPLALLFLTQDLYVRVGVLLVAMASDVLDGYVARRYRQSSPLGVILDPLMDRFFAFFVIALLMQEGSISMGEALVLLSRDFALLLFGLYLLLIRQTSQCRFGAIWCGKASTFLQYLFFFVILFHLPFSSYFYPLFILLGFLAFSELCLSRRRVQNENTVE